MARVLELALVIFFLLLLTSATQNGDENVRHLRSDSSDFDPLSFLVDLDSHETDANSPTMAVHSTFQTSSPSQKEPTLPNLKSNQIKIPVVKKIVGETNEEYQKRRNKRRQLLRSAKSESKKQISKGRKAAELCRYRKKVKEKTGFSSTKQARLAKYRAMIKEGRATDEQKQEIRDASLKRKAINLKYEAKKREQGFKRRSKGWIKAQPSE